MNEDSEKKGGYTPEAADYYDKLQKDQPKKANELWDRSKG